MSDPRKIHWLSAGSNRPLCGTSPYHHVTSAPDGVTCAPCTVQLRKLARVRPEPALLEDAPDDPTVVHWSCGPCERAPGAVQAADPRRVSCTTCRTHYAELILDIGSLYDAELASKNLRLLQVDREYRERKGAFDLLLAPTFTAVERAKSQLLAELECLKKKVAELNRRLEWKELQSKALDLLTATQPTTLQLEQAKQLREMANEIGAGFRIGEPCPVCAQGWLEVKHGHYGRFIGCDQFPSCTYKEQYRDLPQLPNTTIA